MDQVTAADISGFDRLLEAVGRTAWTTRLRELRRGCTPGYAGRALARRHALEFLLDRFLRGAPGPASAADAPVLALLDELTGLVNSLSAAGMDRLLAMFRQGLTGNNTVLPLFHLLRCTKLQRERGFDVHFAGFEDGARFDLLLTRGGMEAEVVCEVVSAEDGRDVHRGAWSNLVDRVDPDLQNWLAAHPGRYLLKMTLPRGLKADAAEDDNAALGELHARITRLLSEQRRADHDEAAVLRLEPLLLAGAQAGESGLLQGLRREFGPEAHLAVTAAGTGVFVMAARAAREDEVAEAVQRRMAELAPARLTGRRPGILAMFIDDTDRLEWRALRDQLRLEGAARQFLTQAAARCVVAVTCASRQELFGATPPDAAEAGELRFRNPSHKQAGAAALAPAVMSTL
jgi:hypothetical protein